MKHLSVLIKPASSLCNLRCKYCFYADVSNSREICSYGVMSYDTADRIIDNLFSDLEDGDALSIAFQGGEPTMAGLPWLEHFVSYAKCKNPSVTLNFALQTNGILLDDAWCHFLKQHKFLVGLSWDGPPSIHNKNRVDAQGQGTYSTILDTRRRLLKHGVDHNILCVLTSEAARHPQQVWKFIEDQKIDYIQFIPCLDDLGSNNQNWALTPMRFYRFYTALFDSWHAAVQNGKYISIKLFDDIANLFVYRQVTACGLTGHCSMQCVIEADGSVYPCDFYVLDEYKLGSLRTDSLSELFQSYFRSKFDDIRPQLPPLCTQCKYASACSGGCKRMRNSMYIDGNFCGYRALLDDILDPLCRDAQKLRQK